MPIPSRPPLDLSRVPPQGLDAVALVINVHTGSPAGHARRLLDPMTPSDVHTVVAALAILCTALHAQAKARPAADPEQPQTLAMRPPEGMAEALGGDDRLYGIGGDVMELTEAAFELDDSVGALVERFANRWQQDGVYYLAVAAAAFLRQGDEGWTDLQVAVDSLNPR